MQVSVVIPVHNGARFLAQTLRTLLNQTAPPAQIVVVDDGSDDDSAAVARGFGPAVEVIRGRFGGAAAARVAGVERTTGDALMFLDADDLLGMDVLEALGGVLARHPDAIACCDWMRYERIGRTWQARPASCPPRRPGQTPLQAWLTGWYHPPCAVLWSRAAYDRSGGWDPAVLVNNDGDVTMRALAAGVDLVQSARGTSYYRRLPDGAVSLSGRRFTADGLASRLAVLDRLSARLDGAGGADATRRALAEAYGNVAGDAEAAGEARLAARAREGDARHGGTRAWDWRRRRADRLRRRDRVRLLQPVPSTVAVPSGPAADAPPDPPRDGNPSPDVPRVSVVVPTYNRTALLERALASVLSQDVADIEILVIDDASTEDIAALLDRIGDPRIRHIRQPRNGGVAAARNRGMAEARAPLIAFLDSDDEWLAGKLSAQLRAMQDAGPRAGLCYTGLVEKGSDGASTVSIPTDRGDVWRQMMYRNVVHYGTSSTMVRREAIEIVGGFDETLPAIEDYDFWTRIARFFAFEPVPEALMIYHDEAPAEGVPDDKRSRDFDANMAARRMFTDRYGDEAVRAGVLHLSHLDNARRHLESPAGHQRRAVVLLIKAIRRAPGAPRLYAWLAFAVLPRPLRAKVFPAMARLRTRLPSRLWTGTDKA